MKKQPEITEKTKRALAAAFCELYAKKPIDKITIKEITSLAGYNRSTFYQYFTDVYDLLEYIEDDLLAAAKAVWEKDAHSIFNPNLQQLMTFFESKEQYLKALLGDYGNVHFLDKLKKELPLEELKNSFSQGEALVPYLIEFHIATSLSLFRVWLASGKNIPSDVLLELIHNLYTKGILYYYSTESLNSSR